MSEQTTRGCCLSSTWRKRRSQKSCCRHGVPKPGKTTLLEHTIRLKPDQIPIRQSPYRIPERMVEVLEKEVHAMLDLGVIEPSASEWSSPIVIVPKKDGSIRVCLDFRRLNAISHSDAYPMPRIDERLEK
ncbi:hypothetical protein AALO_G00304650 [Alosa alosa]|uniref:Transposon Ty3-I Gag-Pol polyprotein n=1 Tax=Alosa alosa TaxID=278164 RepID=A0AAV6FJX3_9TELE|nr:hypothetical protein AALO_G00304650 [Alosa alosa]